MVTISSSLKAKCQLLNCPYIFGEVTNPQDSDILQLLNEIVKSHKYHDPRNSEIQSTREGYKLCGKEPSRYRPSAEALRRRIRSGKGLYTVSRVVDIINVVSIKSGYSIGGYDFTKINGDIIMDIGGKEEYHAIGRGYLNIEFLPCLYDNLGPFGSPTSDSMRTMITPETNELLMVFFNFGNHDTITGWINHTLKLLEKYCKFRPIE